MVFPTHKEYIDSNSPWLGDIPAHWATKKLKFLALVQPSNVDKKTVEGEEPVLLCNYTDVYKNEYIDGSLNFMEATANKEEIRKFSVEIGDVIVTKDSEDRNDIAIPASASENVKNLVCGYHLTQIKPKYLDGRFLLRLFQSKGFNAQFIVAANGVTRFGLPQYAIANAVSPVPPIEEQKAITRFLDHKTTQIDALIAKKQSLLEKLAEQRGSLISQAVTKGLNDSAPMKESDVTWLGEIPRHWETKRLRFLMTMSGGLTPRTSEPRYWGGDIPWVSPKDMKSERLSSSIDTLTEDALNETTLRLYPPGKVLIVVRGMILAHTVPVAVNEVPVTVNQDMKVLETTMNPEYLAVLLRGIQSLVLSIVEESAHGTKVLRTDLLKNMVLPVPPRVEQDEIVSEVARISSRIDRMVSTVTAAITKLHEYRAALVTNAVTGKIDVRDFCIPTTTEQREVAHG